MLQTLAILFPPLKLCHAPLRVRLKLRLFSLRACIALACPFHRAASVLDASHEMPFRH